MKPGILEENSEEAPEARRLEEVLTRRRLLKTVAGSCLLLALPMLAVAGPVVSWPPARWENEAEYLLTSEEETLQGPALGDPDYWPVTVPHRQALCREHYRLLPADARLDYAPRGDEFDLILLNVPSEKGITEHDDASGKLR